MNKPGVNKEVSQQEFEDFLKNYPNTLKTDIVHTIDPPFKSYNDFTLGKWPESVVASIWLNYDEPYQYFIKEYESRI